jgi:hypothetical protein
VPLLKYQSYYYITSYYVLPPNCILRQIGVDSKGTPPAPLTLVGENTGVSKLHKHYIRVLSARDGMCSDNKDWTLKLTIDAFDFGNRQVLLDLDTNGFWSKYRTRVRAITFTGPLTTPIWPLIQQLDQDYLMAMFARCGKDLESLTLAGNSVRALCPNLDLPKIRHLIVRSGRLTYQNFQVFIKKHTQTLETIDLENLDMTLKRESDQPIIHSESELITFTVMFRDKVARRKFGPSSRKLRRIVSSVP